MRWFFPQRYTAAGIVTIEMWDDSPGTFEILGDKYFISMTAAREETEEKVGDLRVSDITLRVFDPDQKFRNAILTGTQLLRLKCSLGAGVIFFGIVRKDQATSADKEHIIDFTAFGQLNILDTVTVSGDLWGILQASERTIFVQRDNNDMITARAVKLIDILSAIARLCGCAYFQAQQYWLFSSRFPHTYTNGHLLNLWAITEISENESYYGMFSVDQSTSPLSFAVKFQNCRELLKLLCNMFFCVPLIRYDPATDIATLLFYQRQSNPVIGSAGRLLDQKTAYLYTSGVLCENEIGVSDPLLIDVSTRSTYGSFKEESGVHINLPWKSTEAGAFGAPTDPTYAYMHFGDGTINHPVHMVGGITAGGQPLHGEFCRHMHEAIARSFGVAYAGKKSIVTRTYHDVSAISDNAWRVAFTNSYTHEGTQFNQELRSIELDVAKNTAKIGGLLL